ncbi:MAG: class I SAM-dependent methyltransferase [Bacteroidetes bacterium]|nr:class I SAM-dependent methyltransferase [Bacteroidota bacterium]
MDKKVQQEWFCNWFNTPYYHILYKNRNTNEAEIFIDNLLTKIDLPPNARIVDVACGKGRHAIYLNKKGFDVTGIDISEESIKHARVFENDTLHFSVHDMRKTFITNYFDAALNLFTSIGYFKTEHENGLAIRSMHSALKKKGKVVIDFFNAVTAMKNIVENEEKTIDGIAFKIKKQLAGKTLVKHIEFDTNGKHFQFSEEVLMLTLSDFEKHFSSIGFKTLNLFGDYSLNTFRTEQSERLIIVGEKI